MGLTLSKAAEWTSAKDGSGGKLEYSAVNKEILNSILNWVEKFVTTRQADFEKLTFKEPLIWISTLSPEIFAGHSEYKKRCSLVIMEIFCHFFHKYLIFCFHIT